MRLKFSVVIGDQMTIDRTSALKALTAVRTLVIKGSQVTSFVIPECPPIWMLLTKYQVSEIQLKLKEKLILWFAFWQKIN